MTTNNFDPSTSLMSYYTGRDVSRPARLWAREVMLHALEDFGAVDFFEGSGNNPVGLNGYATNKLWLRVDAGVTDTVGTIRHYKGGDPTLIASWPELTREGFSAHVGARSGSELDLTWSSSRDGDPGVGKILGNHATLGSITALHISTTGRQGQAYASRIASWDDDDVIRVYAVGAENSFVDVRITATPINRTEFYEVPCVVRVASAMTAGMIVGASHFPTATAIDAAEDARDLAQAARVGAEAAETSAEAARDAAIVARIGAETSETSAEAARDAAFVGANVYADIATGRAAVADGGQFMVVSGLEVVRYRRDSASTHTEMARYPSAAALATSPLNLFADPFFDIARKAGGDATTRIGGSLFYDTGYSNRTWVADYPHTMGTGAWRVSASSAVLSAFNSYFPSAVDTNDSVSLAIIIKAPAGTQVSFAARCFAVVSGAMTGGTWVGSQFGAAPIIATGGEDLIKIPLTVIPVGATGVCAYTFDGTPAGDIHVLAHWVTLNIDAGARPPARRRLEAESVIVRDALGDLPPLIEDAIKGRSTVSSSATSVVVAATQTSAVARGSPFSGWADTYVTPVSIAFNAVRIASLARSPGTPPWSRILVVVRAHATDPSVQGATVVATGTAYLDPDTLTVSDVLVPLRDPATGALKTLTQADLNARFLVGFYAYQRDGSPAFLGEPLGAVSGITRTTSYYIQNTRDPLLSAYQTFSGNPSLALQLELLTSPVQTAAAHPTAALVSRLSGTGLTAPTPTEPILPARLFGMIGREMSAYLASAHSGNAARAYDVTCTLGQQQAERWTHTPTAVADNVALTLDVLDADTLQILGTAAATIDVASATAAGGATKRVLCIGDSTTAAGTYTQRLLDIAALNASAVQPVLMGTLGTGANKHEGRGGWTMDNYFQQLAPGGVANPFIAGAGQKFDLAHYLTTTGQSAPNVVFWHLGINDVFSLASDGLVNARMTTFLDQLRRMIGLTADATVGSVLESNAAAVNVVALPIGPAGSQDAFGDDYANGQTRARYRRNIAIAQYRIRADLGGLEGAKVYLAPWHVSVDPVWGFPGTLVNANATVTDQIRRQDNGVHPNTAGYNQMGDALYACLNWLVSKGHV